MRVVPGEEAGSAALRGLSPAIVLAAFVTASPTTAKADPETFSPPRARGEPTNQRSSEENARLVQDLETAPPPPSHVVYFQYGVAFATEQVIAAGPICDSTTIPCILGGGGGIVVRGGWRSSGPLYLGGAYELTKQDANKLYRIGLLQQARAEGRYYFMTARVTEPYASVGLGVAGYGNEWAIDSWGPSGSIGGGIEYQITRQTVVGLALAYRLLYFSGFTDTAGASRDGGLGQLFGLDLVLEQREAVVRAGADDARPR